MKTKTLTLFTCALMLAVFSIPAVTHNSFPPIIASSLKADSSSWKVQVYNASGFCLARTSNESYLYVGGVMSTGTGWKDTLWKYDSSGGILWNSTTNITGYSSEGFSNLALSPDEESIYAVGITQIGNQTDGILVKLDTTNGNYLWNYTLSGPSFNALYGVAVSPDGKKVYTSGMLSKSSGGVLPNDSFYVAALNSSDGSEIWHYEIYEVNQWGYSQDVAVSPTRDEVYAVGIYYFSNNTYITLVALNATNGNLLWNINSTTDFLPIYSVKVSSDGNTMYAMVFLGPSGRFLTINITDGSILGNMTLTSAGYPYAFDFSPDKSEIFVTAYYIPASYGPQYLLVAEYDFTGTLLGVITAPDSLTHAYGVVASNDNKSVYVAGEYADSIAGDYRMILLKGQPGPLFSPLQLIPLLYMMLSQNPTMLASTNSVFFGIGIAAALVVVGFLIARTLMSRRAEDV